MTGFAYYNDNDPFVCEWLRCLIRKGLLPDGPVDSRSIVDVVPSDIGSFRQCHFFTGIGGWARALDLARWPEDREVWTASLPCQPLSVAGARQGALDGRHLWPAFYRLVAVCRPPTIFGEQVASKDGREWLAGVRIDLEDAGYACGAANLPACAVSAPHRRERLFWGAVGNSYGAGCPSWNRQSFRTEARSEQPAASSAAVADAKSRGEGRWMPPEVERVKRSQEAWSKQLVRCGGASFWDHAEWHVGADGKSRRVKPGVRLLAAGLSGRVGALRGLGNAVVPQVAAEFVLAFMDGQQSLDQARDL